MLTSPECENLKERFFPSMKFRSTIKTSRTKKLFSRSWETMAARFFHEEAASRLSDEETPVSPERWDKKEVTRNMPKSSRCSQARAHGSTSTSPEKVVSLCTPCRNHNVVSPYAGHKRYCPYRNCTCDKCQLNEDRRCTNLLLRDLHADETGRKRAPRNKLLHAEERCFERQRDQDSSEKRPRYSVDLHDCQPSKLKTAKSNSCATGRDEEQRSEPIPTREFAPRGGATSGTGLSSIGVQSSCSSFTDLACSQNTTDFMEQAFAMDDTALTIEGMGILEKVHVTDAPLSVVPTDSDCQWDDSAQQAERQRSSRALLAAADGHVDNAVDAVLSVVKAERDVINSIAGN
ncbi:uncharacterized protein LOC135823167 [Sycon ciliatum]|uniref:uncharacterized protein LOC135823167 n=1 Tax=Sycon ciliatum TaxID=27933 RepID=UPI0031F69712